MRRRTIYPHAAAVLLVALATISISVAGAAQRGEVGGSPSIALGPPDEGERTTPDFVIGRDETPFGTTELVAYGWLAPSDSLPSGPRKQICIWAEHLPKEISWGMCGLPLDPSGTNKITIDSRGGTVGKPAERFIEIGGRLTPDVASVQIFYRRNGRKESRLATVAQVAGDLQRKLHQAAPFGYFSARLRGRVAWGSVRAQAFDNAGAPIGHAPASAVAKRGYFATDPSSGMQAQLRGSNGYGISLSADAGFVSLVARGHHAMVDYAARGVARNGRIKARFGGLGRVALRFHPRGKAHLRNEPEGGCRGGGSLIQPGVFVGKLDFEGEQSYTRIHASRIKGTVTHTKRQVCKNSESDEGEEGFPSSLELTFLNAAADENRTSFNAFKFESKSEDGRSAASFSATVIESPTPGLSVFRSIEGTTKDSTTFSVVKASHGRVDEATVTPPAPFSGSATYRRAVAKKSETWVGSLAGDFPGVGTVSLAGPEFCAEGVLLKGCNGPAAWLVSLFG